MFIVIEGVDGSGKATQTKLLKEKLYYKGYKVESISFPMYGNWSAIFVEKFLKGYFGDINNIDPYIASTFYLLDRFANKDLILSKIQENDFLISDRYSISNFIHRGAKFLQEGKIKEMEKFFDWIYDLEFNKAKLPLPDKIFFLSLSLDNIKKLLLKKAKQQRQYLNGKGLDKAEQDLLHQKFSLEIGKNYLNKWFDNLIIIDCEDKYGNILPPEEISKKILEYININI